METENLQPHQTNSKHWYENKILLIVLFFLFPPMGIYGMLKNKTAMWKKVIYILPSGFLLLLFPTAIIASFFIDNYKEGMDSYNKKDYKNADYFLIRVKPDDAHYKDALTKIAILKPKIDSIEIEERQKKLQNLIKKKLHLINYLQKKYKLLKIFKINGLRRLLRIGKETILKIVRYQN